MGNQAHRPAWLTSRAVAAAGLMAMCGVAHADPLADTAEALKSKALSGSGAYEIVESLTTEVGARPTGSPAMTRAKDWAIAKLTALGFQNVHAEPFAAGAWLRGAESADVVAPYPHKLALAGLGRSVPTPQGGVEAEIALFTTYEAMIARPPGSLAGKIVVVTQPMTRTQDGSGYGAINRMRSRGASEAARRGAVAYLIRSLSTDDTRLPHAGAMTYADDAPKIPAAAISTPDAVLLERLVARGGPVRLKLRLASTILDKAPAWNVVGEIPGREAPDEVVLLGAHLDSWDLGTGAVDDGTGVAIVTSAARLIGALPIPPRRTVRVVLYGAEEMDYSGDAYAEAHKAEAGKIVVASESDFGTGRIWSGQLPAGVADTADGKVLVRAWSSLGVGFNPEPAKRAGSDVQPLVELGVPVFSLRQDGTRYFDLHHSADDTLDKVDPAALDQIVAVWATAAWVMAVTKAGTSPPSAATNR
jgi:Zn-dependent M28 family amino/carboxypeptidase